MDRMQFNKNPVMEGSSVCMTCVYTTRNDEFVSDVHWYHNKKPMYKYTENGDSRWYWPTNDFEIDVSLI